jgi:hypothetical protein
MTHEAIRNSLNDYFDERLSTDVNTEIEIHISECSECSQYLFSLQDLLKKTATLTREVNPQTIFWNDIFTAISEIKTQSLKQKEEIELIANEEERELALEEAEKNRAEKLEAEKLLKREQQKARISESLSQPVYKYGLITIAAIAILFLAYKYLIKSEYAWDVKKLTGDNESYSESFGKLASDAELQNNTSSKLHVSIPDIGNILLEPAARIKRVKADQIQLYQGTIFVRKEFAEKFFSVLVPGAEVKDFFLGGSYKLTVEGSKNSLLEVSDGWVSVNKAGKEAIVLPKYSCRVLADSGLGIPIAAASSPEFKNAIDNYAFSSSGNEEFLLSAVSQATVYDALSLWNLIGRVYLQQREMVVSALFNVVEPPLNVNYEGIKTLDKNMMQRYLEEIEVKIQ